MNPPGIDRPPDELQLRRLSRRGFAVAGASGLAALAGLQWLRTRGLDDGAAWPFRRVLRLEERLSRGAFSPRRLAPTFPDTPRPPLRLNGMIGLDDAGADPGTWRLRVVGAGGRSVVMTLGDVMALPKYAETTELKCIEGWAAKARWGGARLADLAASTGLSRRSGRPYDPRETPRDLLGYVALATPDESYFVGLDVESALHPQSLLAYEIDGAPLSNDHGAPLRLAIPVKYGIKNIKRIGTIRFDDARPSDYWAAEGYDWYAGL